MAEGDAGSRLLKVVLYLTEELLAESDEVLGGALVQIVRGEHQDAKERARETRID